MNNVTAYFATLNGAPDSAERFQSAFRQTFHPDLIIESKQGNMTHDEAYLAISAMIARGFWAELQSIQDNGDGTATMTIRNHIPTTDDDSTQQDDKKEDVTRQIISFHPNGQGIRVHAIDSDSIQFGTVVKRAREIQQQDLASKYASMIACLDGSPNAFAKVEPIFNEIYDHDALTIEYDCGKGKLDFDGFMALVLRFAQQRNVATLETIDLDADRGELRVGIRNIVGGVDQGTVQQIGKIKKGKIVHWSAGRKVADQVAFDRLVSSVGAS